MGGACHGCLQVRRELANSGDLRWALPGFRCYTAGTTGGCYGFEGAMTGQKANWLPGRRALRVPQTANIFNFRQNHSVRSAPGCPRRHPVGALRWDLGVRATAHYGVLRPRAVISFVTYKLDSRAAQHAARVDKTQGGAGGFCGKQKNGKTLTSKPGLWVN